MKINRLNKQKHGYLIYTDLEKTFNGTVVNQTLPSLNGGSLKTNAYNLFERGMARQEKPSLHIGANPNLNSFV